MDRHSLTMMMKQFSFFKSLTEDQIKEIIAECEEVVLTENEILFRQGDDSDSMYLVISGHLIATIAHANGHIDTLSRIKIGEVIGEMGILTKDTRTATVKALVKSTLLKLSNDLFYTLIQKNPKIIHEISFMLAKRYRHAMDFLTNKKKNKHILITKINDSDVSSFISDLKNHIKNEKHIFLCDEVHLLQIYNNKGINELFNYLDNIQKQHELLLYYCEGKQKELLQLLSSHIDVVYAVTLANQAPKYTENYLDILSDTMPDIRMELILLWQPSATIQNSHEWLSKYKYHLHHHVQLGESKHFERLLRFFNGTPVGLVFSGGGTRGWYHLGVLKAFIENKIPIDAIGGTSAGAGAASVYVIGNDFNDMLQLTHDFKVAIKKSISWQNLVIPLISLYSGNPVTNKFIEVFQNRYMEDSPIPFFTVSSNLSLNTEHLHTKGIMWKALRASSALPGVYPPVVENGELLCDGGLMNNFPIDHMRSLLGKEACIIGSDLNVLAEDTNSYSFPPSLSSTTLVFSLLKLKKYKLVYPSFTNTVIKAMLLGSWIKHKSNIQIADFHIHSDLSEFDLLMFDEKKQERLMNIGYKETIEALKKIISNK